VALGEKNRAFARINSVRIDVFGLDICLEDRPNL